MNIALILVQKSFYHILAKLHIIIDKRTTEQSIGFGQTSGRE
jgi:hypothetical protein